jgi:hypothetical protein
MIWPPTPNLLRLRCRHDGIPAPRVTHHFRAQTWGYPGARPAGGPSLPDFDRLTSFVWTLISRAFAYRRLSYMPLSCSDVPVRTGRCGLVA